MTAVGLEADVRCTLGEGIVWDSTRAALLWTDIQASVLWTYSPGTRLSRCLQAPGRVGALACTASGGWLLGVAKYLAMATVHPDTDRVDVVKLTDVEPEYPHTRVNDGRTDRSGNFVFGTLNDDPARDKIGGFYQYSSRHGIRRLALPGAAIPNSICFSPDGTTMWFCDSLDRRIQCCQYDAETATVEHIRTFAELTSEQGLPDGSTIDGEGCLWNAAWGSGTVRRYTPDGRVDREIPVPVRNPTCVTFGEPDLRTLYVTSSREELSDDDLLRDPVQGGLVSIRSIGVGGIADTLVVGL